MVVVLAGGTGGAKLARGMLDVVGDELVVVANTADDVEAYGAYVCPDPDLCAFWLADRIDERGWGLRGDTFHAMDQLRELGVDVWFNLGDRDLAIGLRRAQRLAEGATLTQAIAELTTALGLERARAADGRPAGAHARAGPRALGALPGVHDPRARRGPGRRRRAAGHRGGARARRRSSTRSRAPAPSCSGRRTPSSRCGRSSRSRASAMRCAPPRRRSSPSPPSSAAQVLKGPDGGLHGVGRPAGERGGDGRAPTTACWTAWWPTSPSTACRRSRPTRSWTTPTRAGAWREDVLRFAEAL